MLTVKSSSKQLPSSVGAAAEHRCIWSEILIPEGAEFGPYPGNDAVERNYSEWMAYVEKTTDFEKSNLVDLIRDDQKYYKARKTILPFERFYVWDKNTEIILHNDPKTSFTSSSLHLNSEIRGKDKSAVEIVTEEPNILEIIPSNSKWNEDCLISHKPAWNDDVVEEQVSVLRKQPFLFSGSEELDALDNLSLQVEHSHWNSGPDTNTYTLEKSIEFKEESFSNDESELTESEINPVTCPKCGKQFSTISGLAIHRLMHVQDRTCTACGRLYRLNLHLITHLKSHDLSKISSCVDCEEIFGQAFNFRTNSINTQNMLLCLKCISDREIHPEYKPGVSKTGRFWECKFCNKQYENENLFINHMVTYSGKFFCKICKQSFGSYYFLIRHLSYHTGYKAYECKYCGFRYQNRTAIRKHKCRERKRRIQEPEDIFDVDHNKETMDFLKKEVFEKRLENFCSYDSDQLLKLRVQTTKHLQSFKGINEVKTNSAMLQEITTNNEDLQDCKSSSNCFSSSSILSHSFSSINSSNIHSLDSHDTITNTSNEIYLTEAKGKMDEFVCDNTKLFMITESEDRIAEDKVNMCKSCDSSVVNHVVEGRKTSDTSEFYNNEPLLSCSIVKQEIKDSPTCGFHHQANLPKDCEVISSNERKAEDILLHSTMHQKIDIIKKVPVVLVNDLKLSSNYFNNNSSSSKGIMPFLHNNTISEITGKDISERFRKSFLCLECGREFQSEPGLALHKILHLSMQKCFLCLRILNADFDMNSSLNNILEKPFCNNCEELLRAKEKLKRSFMGDDQL